MSESAQIKAFVALLAILLIGFLVGLYAGWPSDPKQPPAKTVTVEKTVPGPKRTVEHTVYKKKPGSTIWIVVCGNKETTVKSDKPTSECKLPDTGGG